MERNKLPIAAIVLTFNEENKIERCLKSIYDFVQDIYVVDSYSTDKTLDIAKKYTSNIHQHEFENYGKQRNWALNNLPINTDWVLNLDADIKVCENLKKGLIDYFSGGRINNYDAFLITRKTMFMGRWIKYGGHYPVYHAVLFRRGFGHCEEARYNQHFVVKGRIKKISGNLEDIVADDISDFVLRHNKWSSLDALDQVLGKDQISSNEGVKQKFSGTPQERRRFFRKVYMRLPLLLKPFIYFFYRYFLRLGFLDGREGLIFHSLHGFWYQFLVDAKIVEIKKHHE